MIKDPRTAGCFNCGEPDHIARACPYPDAGKARTYLAEIEDSEGHPMAMRLPVGITTSARPPCQHKHSMLCTHP